MRIITLNANGIRSAERKGFFTWMQQQDADVICLQETKAQLHQLDTDTFCPENYHCFYHDAEKKGYSGVALYCKKQPDQIINGLGWADIDNEGRFIEAQFGNLSVISLYLPSGSSGEERQTFKFSVLNRLLPYLQQRINEGRDFIICGDWNIAHRNIDLKNWRGNQKNSGFFTRRTRMAGCLICKWTMGRCVQTHQSRSRTIHMVVKPRTGVGKKCRLAH